MCFDTNEEKGRPTSKNMQQKDLKKTYTIVIVEVHSTLATLLTAIVTLADYSSLVIEPEPDTRFTWIEIARQASPSALLVDIDFAMSIWKQAPQYVQGVYQRWQSSFPWMPLPPLIILTTQYSVFTALQREQVISTVIMKPFRTAHVLHVIEHVLALTDNVSCVHEKRCPDPFS
jgi:hypothetical protein